MLSHRIFVSLNVTSLKGWGSGLQILTNPGLEFYNSMITANFLSEGQVLIINDSPEEFETVGQISLEPGKHHDVPVSAEWSKYVDPEVSLFSMPCAKTVELEFFPSI